MIAVIHELLAPDLWVCEAASYPVHGLSLLAPGSWVGVHRLACHRPPGARTERRLGEILKKMAANGERRTSETARSSSAVRLDDLGIPKDRASRAMQLADVPQDQFDAALAEPVVAQPGCPGVLVALLWLGGWACVGLPASAALQPAPLADHRSLG